MSFFAPRLDFTSTLRKIYYIYGMYEGASEQIGRTASEDIVFFLSVPDGQAAAIHRRENMSIHACDRMDGAITEPNQRNTRTRQIDETIFFPGSFFFFFFSTPRVAVREVKAGNMRPVRNGHLW